MSDDVRGRWRELDQAATAAPWFEKDGLLRARPWTFVADVSLQDNEADTDFIVAARSGWPAAEAECEQLRALLRRIRQFADDRTDVVDLIEQSGIDLEEHP